MTRTSSDSLQDRLTPRYLVIYRRLKERIEAGEFVSKEQLPSQRKLSSEFNVSVMTVRQAMQLLEQEGLVVTRQGLGTHVVQQKLSYELGPLRSLSREMADQGLNVVTHVLNADTVDAHPIVADRLNVSPDAEVYMLERLRLVDDEPIVYQRSYLPGAIGSNIATIDFSERSLYDVLERDLELPVVRAQETIYATVLDEEKAKILRISYEEPAFLSKRLTLTSDGRPTVYDEAFMSGKRFVISADRMASELTINYQLYREEDGQS